ncbi:MAG: c-type cytochrome biogenesis protein CcsB [Actinomycetales bacterium]
MVNQTFAEMSNLLVYSAMVVYALALLAFSADLAGRSRPARPQQAPAEEAAALVGAGGASGGRQSGPAHPPASVSAADPAPSAPDRISKALGIAVALTWLAAALHLGAVVLRGLSVQRVPWANMYEFSLTGSLVVTLVYLGLSRWRPQLRSFGIFAVGPVLLTLGLAMTVLYTQAAQLVPALQSPFLIIHVSIAFISSALFTVAFSVQILQLVAQSGRAPELMAKLPSAQVLDRLGYRLIALSFPLWTFTLVAGAIWAEKAWGRYWGWDPKEVWTFVVWTIYAAYLHARATRGWDGRRATYLALAGFIGIIINFTVVNVVFTGQHSYAGIG